jgi:tetratricopeptide (TPR) repeat protein
VGFSGGAGIALGDFKMDYSIADYGDLGLTNRVSVGYQFTLPPSAPPEEDDSDARVAPSNNSRSGQTASLKPAHSSNVAAIPPSSTVRTIRTTTLDMRSVYHLGINAYKERNFEKAAEYLKKSLTLPSSSADSVYWAEANAILGVIYQYHLKGPGSVDLARKYYEATLEIDPSNSTARNHLPQVEPDNSGAPSR